MTVARSLALMAATLVTVASSAASLLFTAPEGRPLDVLADVLTACAMIPWLIVGCVIVVRVEAHRVGWLLVLASVLGSLAVLGLPFVGLGSASTPQVWAFLLLSVVYGPWFATLILAAMLMFPDGQLPGPRWRLPVGAIVIVIVVTCWARILHPGPIAAGMPDNPLGIDVLPVDELRLVETLTPAGIVVLALLGVASLAVRYRRSGRLVREQLKWLLVAVVPFIVAAPVAMFEADQSSTSVADLVEMVSLLTLMPATIGIAITRYRLYEIDRVVSRGLAWGLLTGTLLAVYAGAVLLLQGLLAGLTQGETLAVAASTLLAAALFQPLRVRLQRAMDRRFDRARYDGERTAQAFAGRLRDQVDLAGLRADIVGTVRDALRPGSTTIWIRRDKEVQR